jgi:uncharacterized membrane protein required for colicin V production
LDDWRIKIAALWVVFEFGMFTVPVVEMYIPNFMENAIAQTTPGILFVLASMTMIPPILAFLSLILKDSINRWVNVILGVVFAALTPIGVLDVPTEYYAPMILIAIVEVVAAALIVWYAWKSKQKA